MGELPSMAGQALEGLAIEAVEWLPSGADSGLVRVRGRWAEGVAGEADLPSLILRSDGRDHRFESLPDARFGRDARSWRGSYLVPAGLVATEPEALWVEWPGGARAALPAMTRGIEPPPVDAPEKPVVPAAPGGQVIDRAVLAERRARRAEAAEQQQARVAAEAVKAVEVLELRSAELERRLEEATAERDAIAARVQAGDGERTERERRALAAALESAARLRAQAREWRVRLRADEVARSSDAVRLAVVESERATIGSAHRSQLQEQAALLEATATELEAAQREAAEARAELERARAAAAEQLADARAAWERRRAELEAALAEVRAQLDAARTEAEAALRADADRRAAGVRAIHDEVRTELQRRLDEATFQAQAEAARAGELERRVAEAEAAAERANALGVRLAEAEAAAANAEARLRTESVARAALEDELDRERLAMEPLAGDLEAAVQAREAAEAALATIRGELAAATAARETAAAALAAAEMELDAERTARLEAEAALAAARADAEREGESLQARIAELEQRAATAPDLERLAREQADAAAAREPQEPKPDLAERLAAAEAALRERTPAPEQPPRALTIVSPKGPPPRADVVGTSRRGYPLLRGALVKLAHDDPAAAARLLAGLLPAQGAVVEGPLSYDLTILEVGTFAVAIADGRATAEAVDGPRGRRHAAFHLRADALTLAELLAGVEHRIGRFRGRARLTGRRRRAQPLRALPGASITLAEAARAGASIEPGLAWQALTYAIHPSWTRGLVFTVAAEVVDPQPRTWYLTARDGGGLARSDAAPAEGASATVRMSRAAFDRLLRDEQHPSADKPAVRGDREAVAALLGLIDRARG